MHRMEGVGGIYVSYGGAVHHGSPSSDAISGCQHHMRDRISHRCKGCCRHKVDVTVCVTKLAIDAMAAVTAASQWCSKMRAEVQVHTTARTLKSMGA